MIRLSTVTLPAFALFINLMAYAQTNLGTSFSGKINPAAALCPTSRNAFSDNDVNRLITEILSISNLKNRFIIISCPSISNCQAIYYEGKPYILYNSAFLEGVKSLSFSEKSIVTTDKNWQALTTLAHELGHHFNNHLNNPPPGVSGPALELEADEYAGFVIYMLGGTLAQAQAVFNSSEERPTYTHPGRKERFDAIAKGYNDAARKYPKNKSKEPVTPEPNKPKNVTNLSSVVMAGMTWMDHNLDVERFRNGDLIPQVQSAAEWRAAGDAKQPAWCYYNNNQTTGAKYGKLYNGYAVSDPRGLCPSGWHVPSDSEWAKLIKQLGGESTAGTKMKSTSGWLDNNGESGNGTNASGFSGLPGGYRFIDGVFNNIGKYGYWWSSSGNSNTKAWNWFLYHGDRTADKYEYSKVDGFSVRCVKDQY